jgi:hypothetical protein
VASTTEFKAVDALTAAVPMLSGSIVQALDRVVNRTIRILLFESVRGIE